MGSNTGKQMTDEELAAGFSYEPTSGEIFSANGRKVGSKLPIGYVYVTAKNRKILAHRLAWFLHYGVWPDGQIDHINRDRTDNAISNLRVVSPSENAQNTGIKRSNSSGFTGVVQSCDGKWYAQIRAGGKRLWLGAYAEKESAAKAYAKARAELHTHAASNILENK